MNIDLLKWIFNSIFVASWVTVLQVTTSSLAAFAFSRIKWKFRNQVFIMYLATMMIPSLILTIPQFQIMVSLNLVNTYAGLILPAAFSAFGTFMLRQFMLGIPLSYDEAAEIDGANWMQIYLDIILPLTKPGLITLAIFTFLGNYRNLMWAFDHNQRHCAENRSHRTTFIPGIVPFTNRIADGSNYDMYYSADYNVHSYAETAYSRYQPGRWCKRITIHLTSA